MSSIKEMWERLQERLHELGIAKAASELAKLGYYEEAKNLILNNLKK